jgi:hypothetical protein
VTSETGGRRFTGKQITTMVVAVAIAIIAFPVGVYAATGSLVNITDPVHAAQKAHVNTSGRLLTNVNGAVDSRLAPPLHPFRYTTDFAFTVEFPIGITSSTINITSLTVTPTGTAADFRLYRLKVSSTDTMCSNVQPATLIYSARSLAGGKPLTVSFPTPLSSAPEAGARQCLELLGATNAVDISGFYS